MTVVHLFYPRPGVIELAAILAAIKATGRDLIAELEDGVVSILSPNEEWAILGIGRDERTGRFHAVDKRGRVVSEGPTLGDATRALYML
jgi:hypothetical protein